MTVKQKKLSVLVLVVVVLLIAVYIFILRKPETPSSSEGSYTNPTEEVFLPNGTSFDDSILKDPRAAALIPPVYPTVTREELGVSEPFQ